MQCYYLKLVYGDNIGNGRVGYIYFQGYLERDICMECRPR